MAGTDWTREEVEAVVADYIAMLTSELRGEPYSKTEHRRLLKPMLQDRSDGSIERKHQNISAILLEIGYPAIDGYKPLRNYQSLLSEVVVDRVSSDLSLQSRIVEDMNRSANVPSVEDILSSLVAAPLREPQTVDRTRESPLPAPRGRLGVNYLELEAMNASLGRFGEEFVLNFERAWLLTRGRDGLASKVEHVSTTRGDGLGYDVMSFEEDGREKWLEVKTTKYGRYTPFFATRREVDVSHNNQERFQLCRVFDFRTTPRFYRVPGSMMLGFDLDPSQYVVRVA